MEKQFWKVGELASASGVTVRTLHWYDEISLLRPSHRTASGHRLYEAADAERLQQIRSLQALGLSLDEVKATLSGPGFSPRDLLVEQISRLQKRIEEERTLCERLERIVTRMDENEQADAGELLAAIREMQMIEKIESFYTPEQLETLRKRREALGEETIEAVQKEWPELMRKIRDEMDKGTDPTSPEVRKLVARHEELLQQFHGGDPGIIESMKNVYRNMGAEITREYDFPLDSALSRYMEKAKAEDRGGSPQ